ncbi:Bug family tripartite tricarboxylate transporter substrate binding protein [Falsiroseomonas oryzae]|uniref:Bug family tripartite tricarboxylate transporter substrate binding protein n=1 Tax=Falsiroseomonas oryzae TaxID=2766473 RepID=UPI0022EA7B74|nr:tripartite tricarboxylate transporter substrate binding protein [Roseomonas sp. MO-31]
MQRRTLLAAGAAALATRPALAQGSFPDRAVRILVPFPPGGATDIIARMVAERLQGRWRQGTVIENRPGAGTIVGSQAVARAPADGYTLGFVISAHTINPALRRDLPYDTLRDFAHVTQVCRAHVALAAHPDLPARNLREVVELSKRQPGGLSVATPGIGTVMHMVMELLAAESGANFVHVPYQGGAPALADVTTGRVPLMLDPWHAMRPQVEAGRLRVVAASSSIPVPGAETIPLMMADYPAVTAFSVIGLVAPAGTPPAIVNQVQQDVHAVVHAPDMAARMAEMGLEPVASTPAEFARLVETEIPRWREVVRARGIQPM